MIKDNYIDFNNFGKWRRDLILWVVCNVYKPKCPFCRKELAFTLRKVSYRWLVPFSYINYAHWFSPRSMVLRDHFLFYECLFTYICIFTKHNNKCLCYIKTCILRVLNIIAFRVNNNWSLCEHIKNGFLRKGCVRKFVAHARVYIA